MTDPQLNDDSPMPWGKHKGTRLGDVPLDYLKWALKQDWIDVWPDLKQYAETVTDTTISGI